MIERKYASVKHPSISGLVEGLYLYKRVEDAIERLNALKNQFILSRDSEHCPEGEFVLWIKGFAIAPEEDAKGCMGNFAHVLLGLTDKGLHTIRAQKVAKPLSHHPQKRRLESPHPNWGHPFLRRIKRDRPDNVYNSVEEAQEKLAEFALEFPKVTIPNPSRLYCIVYAKTDEAGQPNPSHTQRIVIDVVQRVDGKYKMIYRNNDRRSPPTPSEQACGPNHDTSDRENEAAWNETLSSKLHDLLGGGGDAPV